MRSAHVPSSDSRLCLPSRLSMRSGTVSICLLCYSLSLVSVWSGAVLVHFITCLFSIPRIYWCKHVFYIEARQQNHDTNARTFEKVNLIEQTLHSCENNTGKLTTTPVGQTAVNSDKCVLIKFISSVPHGPCQSTEQHVECQVNMNQADHCELLNCY